MISQIVRDDAHIFQREKNCVHKLVHDILDDSHLVWDGAHDVLFPQKTSARTIGCMLFSNYFCMDILSTNQGWTTPGCCKSKFNIHYKTYAQSYARDYMRGGLWASLATVRPIASLALTSL